MGRQKAVGNVKAKGPFYIYRDGDSLIGVIDEHASAVGYKETMERCHPESTFEILSGLKKPAKKESEG